MLYQRERSLPSRRWVTAIVVFDGAVGFFFLHFHAADVLNMRIKHWNRDKMSMKSGNTREGC